ncbi:MAG TPA: hypothetical protein VKE24_06115 [Candidatus Acidoferrales bacterium]|nr:hypothetical protein [Candidatus Acidoferrales bacterium]
MARYFALLGRHIEVRYRAGALFLLATGTLVADSGKSIFLEQHFSQQGREKNFRWEIPYQHIVELTEISAELEPQEPIRPERSAAATAVAAPLKNRPSEA